MKMKSIFLFSGILFLSLFSTDSFSQIQQPAKWSSSVQQKEKGEAILTFSVKIDKGWHIYSQFIAEGGPIPTSLSFEKNSNFSIEGKANEEGKLIDLYDKSFEMKLKYFENKFSIHQKSLGFHRGFFLLS